jgi:HPt (histidine-containing phosphotransfer) domain-containing protein
MGGDVEAVREMVGAFLEMAPALLDEMRAALGRRDAKALRTAAHTLKPNAQMFGARALHQACVALEQHAAEGALDAAAPLVPTALALGERALRELREWSAG